MSASRLTRTSATYVLCVVVCTRAWSGASTSEPGVLARLGLRSREHVNRDIQ